MVQRLQISINDFRFWTRLQNPLAYQCHTNLHVILLAIGIPFTKPQATLHSYHQVLSRTNLIIHSTYQLQSNHCYLTTTILDQTFYKLRLHPSRLGFFYTPYFSTSSLRLFVFFYEIFLADGTAMTWMMETASEKAGLEQKIFTRWSPTI